VKINNKIFKYNAATFAGIESRRDTIAVEMEYSGGQ